MNHSIRALAAFTLLLAFVPRYGAPRVHAQQSALNAIEACIDVASHHTNLLTLQKVRLCNAAPNASGPCRLLRRSDAHADADGCARHRALPLHTNQ